MSPLKILIVEDDIITATDLKETLEKAGYSITDMATTYEEALASAGRDKPDLAIIDITLEGSTADGVHTAKDLVDRYSIPVVYLTANSESKTFQRARETFPAAYLLKPFDYKELAFQIELASQYYALNKQSDSNPHTADAIFLPVDNGHQKIRKEDVVCLKADGSYVKVYLKNEETPYLFSMNLGYLSQYFTSPNFYRLSRSVTINLKYLEQIKTTELYLKGYSSPIPIPERKKSDLMKQLAVVRTP